ncbi:MAG: hypothetical protein JRN09_02885 [Nitrososphaerota archaeon]|nr:hypothetical protein [Nitrososphaerota archaeon]
MTEYKKEVSIVAVIAVVAALAVGASALAIFPSGSSSAPSPTTILFPPAALTGQLYAESVSCSLSTGVCTFTIVNNSTVPLDFEGCHVVQTEVIGGSNSTATLSNPVNGTIGGAATAGIPASSHVEATCAVPTAPFAGQTAGSQVSVSFSVKLVDDWYSYHAGTVVYFTFPGTWTN